MHGEKKGQVPNNKKHTGCHGCLSVFFFSNKENRESMM